MLNTTQTTSPARQGAAVRASVLPSTKARVLPPAQPRQPFRVLQTSRSPAQLSLFMRPGLDAR